MSDSLADIDLNSHEIDDVDEKTSKEKILDTEELAKGLELNSKGFDMRMEIDRFLRRSLAKSWLQNTYGG